MNALSRLLGVATVVDDRARQIEIVPSPEALALLSRWQRLMLWRWATPAYVAAVVIVVAAIPWLVCPLVGFSLIFIPLGIGSRSRRLAALSRAALAAGACGGCGYRIEDRHVAEDGLRVCPECGGAWLANAPTPQAVLVPFTFQRHYRGWYRVIRWGMPTIRDDRGQILPQRVSGKHALTLGSTAAKRGILRLLAASAVIWVGMMVAGFMVFVTYPEWFSRFSLAGMAVTLVGMVAIGVSTAWSLQVGRGDALAVAACPACGTDLGESPPEADGCVKCASCWAAWRAAEVRWPVEVPAREPSL